MDEPVYSFSELETLGQIFDQHQPILEVETYPPPTQVTRKNLFKNLKLIYCSNP